MKQSRTGLSKRTDDLHDQVYKGQSIDPKAWAAVLDLMWHQQHEEVEGWRR